MKRPNRLALLGLCGLAVWRVRSRAYASPKFSELRCEDGQRLDGQRNVVEAAKRGNGLALLTRTKKDLPQYQSPTEHVVSVLSNREARKRATAILEATAPPGSDPPAFTVRVFSGIWQ